MEVFVFMALCALFWMFVYAVFPNKPKDDPDESVCHEFAKKMLRGETTPEEIAQKEGYDPEHVKKWKDDFTQLAVKYALESDKHNARISLMEDDIKWFKEVCRKYIGEDWEKKTGFADRDITKFSNEK